MMKTKFSVSGWEEVYKGLDQTNARVNRGVNNAIKKSGEPLKQRIESTTPRSTDARWKYGEGHAADHVGISGIRGKADYKFVKVGYQAKTHDWRMWFLETGTYSRHNNEGGSKGIRPHRIVQKAAKGMERTVLSLQAQELKKVLK